MGTAPIPAFKLNDAKTTVFGDVKKLDLEMWQNASFPDMSIISTRHDMPVARIYEDALRDYAVQPLDSISRGGFKGRFLPMKLLEHILNKDAILNIVTKLIECGNLPKETENECESSRAADYWANKICATGTNSGFRRILALLLLMDQEEFINIFITQEIVDDALPVREGCIELPPSRRWKSKDTDYFFDNQSGIAVPFFAPDPKTPDIPPHIKFESNDVKPWARTRIHNADMENLTLGGAFGEVHQVIIHPWQHEFHQVLQDLSAPRNLFALKTLYSGNEKAFKRETQMLTRFGGHHGNIVTLLATIHWDGRFGLLFPWAEYDLLKYWETFQQPKWDHDTLIWIVSQYQGIVSAIAHIHNPHIKNINGEELYGRHGDIKPENVLWFKKDDKGVLVLSDLGLAAEHRDTSRSNIPGHNIPGTPNYRPPECDMDGPNGFISRSFDIWTLGCLFLEFVVWTLCGWEERNRFRTERCSLYITDFDNDIYFDICRLSGKKDAYAFKIKDAVTNRFASLHKHPNCSQFFHDFLDLIQTEMLIVESDVPRKKRTKAADLLQGIEKMTEKCRMDKAYCFQGCPQERLHTSLEAVEIGLNQKAKDLIVQYNMKDKLQLYDGRTRTANPRSEREIKLDK